MPNRRYYFIQSVAQSPAVRRKIAEVRNRKAAQARAIMAAEGVEEPLILDEGTRPKGRSFARLAISADVEFGTAATTRRRILGRVTQA